MLFGSTARGLAGAASDVDLLVIASTLDNVEEVAAEVRRAVASVFPLDLAIASIGAKTARNPQPTWLRNALAEGETRSRTSPETITPSPWLARP